MSVGRPTRGVPSLIATSAPSATVNASAAGNAQSAQESRQDASKRQRGPRAVIEGHLQRETARLSAIQRNRTDGSARPSAERE
jgi:hypothetical protein